MASVPVVDYFQEPFPAATRGNRFGIHGPYYGPQGHRGQDWRQPGGTAIKVIAHGIVVSAFWSYVLGNVTVVRHALRGGGYVYSGYCHQSARTVKVGQVVKRGATIGRVGTTGSASSGNHLHMTISRTSTGVTYGEVLDPLGWISTHGKGTPAAAVTAPAKAKYTTAKSGEGLSAIAKRSKITLARIKALNPNIVGPEFVVDVGKKIRVA